MPVCHFHYKTQIELMRTCLLLFFIFLSLMLPLEAYKEFALLRSSVDSTPECITQQEEERVYRQVCFRKDVDYHLELFIDGLIYYIGVDLTAPLSWLKSPDCRNGLPACRIIEDSQKSQVEQEFKDVRVRFRMFGHQHKVSHQEDVTIVGPGLVSGEVEKVEFAEFYAKDSRSARDLTRLLGMSLFLAPERDRITISNATVVKAERLSKEVNEMMDGAISFMPLQERNTLLSQLLVNSGKSQQIVTLFIHPSSKTGTLSFGDISLKNAASSAREIIWIPLLKNTTEGVSFITSGIQIKQFFQQNSSLVTFSSRQEVILTTSSSCIFLPKQMLQWLVATLKNTTGAKCWSSERGLRCEWKELQGKREAITFVLSFQLSPKQFINIPFITLILISQGLFIEMAVRPSPSEKVILGEPLFEQYVIYIDYETKRVGFIKGIFHHSDKFKSLLVYFLRALLFTCIFLLLAYVCYNPCVRFQRFMERRWKKRGVWGWGSSFEQLGSTEFN